MEVHKRGIRLGRVLGHHWSGERDLPTSGGHRCGEDLRGQLLSVQDSELFLWLTATSQKHSLFLPEEKKKISDTTWVRTL